jgi:hypothetical protein
VARFEASPVHAEPQRIVERHLLRQHRRRLAVASSAEPLGVTRLTEIARRRRALAVLAQPVSFMNEVIGRFDVLALKILVTAIAGPNRDIVLVLVAAEAQRHWWAHVLRVGEHALVAMHALTVRALDVAFMVELQRGDRHPRFVARVIELVALPAITRVVRRRMATNARGGGGKVIAVGVGRDRHPSMAFAAVDPLRSVLPVGKGFLFRRLDPEDACACGYQHEEQREQ